LIDRGQGVLEGLKLLGEPWFHTVRGNHEQMLIDAYEKAPHAPYAAHGARWWMTIDEESKPMIIQRLASLPIAIEIETPRGLVGVVHADVPHGSTWQTFVQGLDDPQYAEIALWGRDRIKKHVRDGVTDAWRVCTGHTWIPSALRLGNVLALDVTGGGEGPLAVFCVQDDTIYVDGKPVSLDQAERLTEDLAGLEQKFGELKTLVNSNKLIESQVLSREVESLSKQINSAWLLIQDDIADSQRLINALHGLSLLRDNGRPVKLKELKGRYAGTQIEEMLQRLFQ
jgi:serine/threonine protein phosphatase 1